jgi:hypothetical protein
MSIIVLLFIIQNLIVSINSENITKRNVTNRNVTNKILINKKFLIENCNFNYITPIRIKLIPTVVYKNSKKINFTNYNDIIDKRINLLLNIDRGVCEFFVKKYKRIVIFNEGRYYRPRFIFFYNNYANNNNCIDFSLNNKTLVNNACYVYNDIFLHNYIPSSTTKYKYTTQIINEKYHNNTLNQIESSISNETDFLILYITIPIAFFIIIMLGLFFIYNKKQNRVINDIENQITELKSNIKISIE